MTKTDIANLALSKLGQPAITSIDDTEDRDARLCKLHYDHALKEALRSHFWGFAMTCPQLSSVAFVVATISGDLTQGVDDDPVTFPELMDAGDEIWTSDGNADAPDAGTWYRFTRSSPTWTASVFVDGSETVFWESLPDIEDPDGLELTPAIGASGTATVAFGNSSQILPWGAAWDYPIDMLKLRQLQDSSGNKIEKFALRRFNGKRLILTREMDAVFAEYVQYVDDPDEYDPTFLEAFVTLLAAKVARVITGSEGIEGDMRQLYESNAMPAARTADSHDSRSNENRPIDEILKGNLLRHRGDYLQNLDE